MKKWYAVRTFVGYEGKVKENIEKLIKKSSLESSIEEIFIPTYKNYTYVRREVKLKEELIFPGYVFIKMRLTNELMYSVRGVQYILGYAGVNEVKKIPDSMSEDEVKKMKEDSKVITSSFQKNDKVIIVDALEEFEVEIDSIDVYKEEVVVKYQGEKKKYRFENMKKIK